MFREKTLFIVGAGASHEIGLPVGAKLKEDIARVLEFEIEHGQITKCDRYIIESIKRLVQTQGHHDINPHLRAAWHIRNALEQASSIDNFLYSHQDNAELVICGKLAIVRSILLSEKSSRLYVNPVHDDRDRLPDVRDTWYGEFFRLLVDGVQRTDVRNIFNNVSFIVFNYDRCIEHYLVKSLSNYYGISLAESSDIVKQAKILHPYGTVGRLEWQTGTSMAVNYGSSDIMPLHIASQIKTFSERVEDESALEGIRDCVRSAEKIVFLGFSFHPQNMEILNPSGSTRAKKIFATAFGISDSDSSMIGEQLEQVFYNKTHTTKIHVRNTLKCNSLFSEYWRNLAF